MTDNTPLISKDLQNISKVELDNLTHPAWDEPIMCRVEVDLPGWLKQLTGGKQWEVFGEDEAETCISFSMRERYIKQSDKQNELTLKMAEVTLYHNGYAVVDVDGKALFDGTLTNGTSDCAHLSYFHADTGEPIMLN